MRDRDIIDAMKQGLKQLRERVGYARAHADAYRDSGHCIPALLDAGVADLEREVADMEGVIAVFEAGPNWYNTPRRR
jgi:hypothetical protein